MYFYYGDESWDMLRIIIKAKADVSITQSVVSSNQPTQGGYDSPTLISESEQSYGSPILHTVNLHDMASTVSDVSSLKYVRRRIKTRCSRPSISSTQISTAVLGHAITNICRFF